MGEDEKYNLEEADWNNLFPDTSMKTNRYTGIKISNAEAVSDFFTSVFPFKIDRSSGVLIPSDDNDINLFLKEIENGTVNNAWTATACLQIVRMVQCHWKKM